MMQNEKIVRFIGDVHGKYSRYRELIRNIPKSIQVGDMGVGFRHITGAKRGEFYTNPPHYAMVKGKHRFIRGNHDNPGECKIHSQWIKDGHFEDDMLFIGGALSIDKEFRIENYTWWKDEELSYEELLGLMAVFGEKKPKIFISHECPDSIADRLCNAVNGSFKLEDGSRTRIAFDQMRQLHTPKLHIFGHWHMSFDETISGTRFICLNELEFVDVNIETLEITMRGQG